jgi:hypothetical protein
MIKNKEEFKRRQEKTSEKRKGHERMLFIVQEAEVLCIFELYSGVTKRICIQK